MGRFKLATCFFALVFGLSVLAGCRSAHVVAPERVHSQDPRFAGVRMLQHPGGQGTGFIIDADSEHFYLVTAYHVVRPRSIDGGSPDIRVLYHDADNDIALVRIPRDENAFFAYRLGIPTLDAHAVAIGYGQGFPLYCRGWVTSMNFNEKIAFNGGVHPGMSGGPLVDTNGRVIGLIQGMPVYGFSMNHTVLLCLPGEKIQKFLLENSHGTRR